MAYPDKKPFKRVVRKGNVSRHGNSGNVKKTYKPKKDPLYNDIKLLKKSFRSEVKIISDRINDIHVNFKSLRLYSFSEEEILKNIKESDCTIAVEMKNGKWITGKLKYATQTTMGIGEYNIHKKGIVCWYIQDDEENTDEENGE